MKQRVPLRNVRIRVYPKCIGKCPVEQDHIRALQKNAELIHSAERYEAQLQTISKLAKEGTIIALRDCDDYVEIIGYRGSSLCDVYYYRVGFSVVEIGSMGLRIKDNGTVVLDDWHILSENDRGYGSYFLSAVIEHLKRKGYKKVIGEICPVDFGHEDKLRHIYEKFGFEIKDRETHRSIFLALQENPTVMLRNDTVQWLAVLEGLSHSNLAERLGLTEQEFEQVSRNVLFQEEVLHAAAEIGEKYADRLPRKTRPTHEE